MKPNDFMWVEDGMIASTEEITYDEFINGKYKGDKMTDHFTKVIEYKRGTDFKCIVGYNAYSDHISFRDIIIPTDTPKDVSEQFFDDAHEALLLIIDKEASSVYEKNGTYLGD